MDRAKSTQLNSKRDNDGAMLLTELVRTSRAVAATSGRLAKVEALATLLAALTAEEVEVGTAWLSGEVPGGKLGIGWALVRDARGAATTAGEPSLEILAVQRELRAIGELAGAGSKAARLARLAALFSRATADEQEFLAGLLTGELRQGALAGLVADAVARVAGVPAASVRRAAMLAGDLPRVARAALEFDPTGSRAGERALAAFRMELFRPVQPMLAEPIGDVEEALAALGTAALEYKLDGARVQVHKEGERVRVFTRGLNDVTAAVPEVVDAVRALPAHALVLDGEVLALRADGKPQPFQLTMRRFGRKLGDDTLRGELPLAPYFFDALWIDGDELLDRPLSERSAALITLVPERFRVPRIVTADPGEGRAFFERALAEGHEGLVAKDLGSPYAAGARGSAWLKVKLAHTLDLVVLAAEWGSGRRRGFLSNLHLGARDPSGGFAMLGKTFKGLTDEMLAWQTERLLALEVARDGHVVHVRPELVVEIAVNELQESPHYPAGLALRFARVKRYRTDKRPEEADTVEAARKLRVPREGES